MSEQQKHFPEFYVTAPQPCPYLAGRLERKLFTHLTHDKPLALVDNLLKGGFRRSQNIAYMPYCEGCQACISVRVLVDEFQPRRSLRRVLDANRDLTARRLQSTPTTEQYALFRAYIDARHADGGMADMTVLDYAIMVEDSHVETRMIEYRRGQKRRPWSRQWAAARSRTHGRAQRRALHGLLVFRFRRGLAFARHLHDSRPYLACERDAACLCLSRLLGRGLAQNGLQGPFPAAGAAYAPWLDAGGTLASNAIARRPNRRFDQRSI